MLALAFVLVSVAANCNGDESGDCEPTRTVEVLGTWSGDEQNNFQRVLDKFEATSGIDVRYESTGRNIADALNVELTRRNTDVAILPQPGLLHRLESEGHLLSIDDLKAHVEENFARHWVDLGKGVDGKLYGVWFKANNKSTIWFDAKVSPEAQAYPQSLTTWPRLLAEAERLASAGKTAFAIAGGETDAWVLTDWFENVYLRTAGAENYDKLTRHEIRWDHGTVKTALGHLAQIFSRQEWLFGGREGVLNTGFPDSVHHVFFTPARASMVYEGDFLTAFIPPDAIQSADFFDFPDFPGVEEQSIVVGGNVAVALKPGRGERENCGAKELLRALTTAETVEPWARIGGGFSSANALIEPMLPSESAKRAARELRTQGIVFDLSDQQPPSFGVSPGEGMYEILRNFVRDPSASNVDRTAARLELERSRAR